MSFRRGQLEYFVAVVEEGQMTRAARRLHIAQPALSQAIAQLETELGLKLLERHARGVTPTDTGLALYEKACLAVAATDEAMNTARSLARARQGTIEFGFLGAPPNLDSRVQMEAFARRYPEIDLRFHELPFPSESTSEWMAGVDVAVCHAPPADERVWSHHIRQEPRVALLPGGHRLAGRDEVTVGEIIDDTYVGFDPSVDPVWAGFWSLDDHRGAAPGKLTPDRVGNPQEVLAALSGGTAITTVPAAAATVLAHVLPSVAAVPIVDALPSRIELVGHVDRRNPLVLALVNFARRLPPPAVRRERRPASGQPRARDASLVAREGS